MNIFLSRLQTSDSFDNIVRLSSIQGIQLVAQLPALPINEPTAEQVNEWVEMFPRKKDEMYNNLENYKDVTGDYGDLNVKIEALETKVTEERAVVAKLYETIAEEKENIDTTTTTIADLTNKLKSF